jgi:1-acyl-sn-glycerol-3-phosphate acyltransferase
MLYAILKPIVVLLMRLLFRLEGRGMEHVPARGPVLLVANHSSVLDPPLVGGMAPRPVSYLAKAELFGVPLLGRLIHALNARPVRREGADAGALRTALRALAGGAALLVFPEGTRGDEGVLREPKAGAGMLAVLSGAPVVPVYISGSGRAWPRGQRLLRPHKIVVTFGPPLALEASGEMPRKERYAAASHAMMAAIGRVKDTAVGTDSPGRVPWQAIQAVGGAGMTAQGPTQKSDGRNGRYGEGRAG